MLLHNNKYLLHKMYRLWYLVEKANFFSISILTHFFFNQQQSSNNVKSAQTFNALNTFSQKLKPRQLKIFLLKNFFVKKFFRFRSKFFFNQIKFFKIKKQSVKVTNFGWRKATITHFRYLNNLHGDSLSLIGGIISPYTGNLSSDKYDKKLKKGSFFFKKTNTTSRDKNFKKLFCISFFKNNLKFKLKNSKYFFKTVNTRPGRMSRLERYPVKPYSIFRNYKTIFNKDNCLHLKISFFFKKTQKYNKKLAVYIKKFKNKPLNYSTLFYTKKAILQPLHPILVNTKRTRKTKYLRFKKLHQRFFNFLRTPRIRFLKDRYHFRKNFSSLATGFYSRYNRWLMFWRKHVMRGLPKVRKSKLKRFCAEKFLIRDSRSAVSFVFKIAEQVSWTKARTTRYLISNSNLSWNLQHTFAYILLIPVVRVFSVSSFLNSDGIKKILGLKRSNVFMLRYKPFINTRGRVNFILSNSGFLTITRTFKLLSAYNKPTVEIKKKHYSFLIRNELQKFIIKKYNKEFNAFMVLNKNRVRESLNFTPSFLKNKENFIYSSVFSNEEQTSFKSDANLCSSLSSYKIKNYTLKNIKEKISLKDETPHIRKIRFKPGYMTIWREARSVLKQLWGLNFRYQYRLTRYLGKFQKLMKVNLFLSAEMCFKNVLSRSRIFVDITTPDYFIKCGLFYINGVPCFNPGFQLHRGDFVQMLLGLKYYISYKWFTHWIGVKKLKLKLRTRKKSIVSISDENKTRTKSYPLWILKYKNFTEDTPPFLELDFVTLSVFVIYEPTLLGDISTESFIWDRYPVLNMYNWKYIN